MADKWVIDADHPNGHAVPMTAEEEAQRQADQQEAVGVAAVEETARRNGATLRQRAETALSTNAAFLALASPTAAQVRDQTVALTKECSALIRLLIGKLESTDGAP